MQFGYDTTKKTATRVTYVLFGLSVSSSEPFRFHLIPSSKLASQPSESNLQPLGWKIRWILFLATSSKSRCSRHAVQRWDCLTCSKKFYQSCQLAVVEMATPSCIFLWGSYIVLFCPSFRLHPPVVVQ